MERRRALQAIVYFSIASNSLIACKNNYQAIKELGLKNIKPTDGEVDLIDAITKTIFPIENVPLFKGHTSMPFVLKMVDELYTKEDREKYLQGMKAFNDLSKNRFKKSFNELSKEEKTSLLKQLMNSKEENTAKHFFDITRNQTIIYFTSTEDYLRGIKKYEMAPGRWISCLNIDQIQSKKL
jgi:Gluconate 2-dehydrogenase subunit 3